MIDDIELLMIGEFRNFCCATIAGGLIAGPRRSPGPARLVS